MRMVDLIRAQQKGKKATPRPVKSAPAAAEPEPEIEGETQASEPPKETWKAALAPSPPPPEEPSIFVSERSGAAGLYAAAVECLDTIVNAALRREPFAIEPAVQMAERLAKAVAAENLVRAPKDPSARFETLLMQALASNGDKHHLAHKGLNVAIYALKLGDILNYSLTKLTELAVAGMVYDIGLTRLPTAVLSKSGPLTERERASIQEHPTHSYEILRGLGPTWEWLAEVGLQHHEREDGNGYPKGLSGGQIHEYAKIVGLCDIYEALAHMRPYRGASVPLEVVKRILQHERERFPKAILKAFLNGMSSYPVGSWVRLSTKEIARVIATNKTNPLRPVIEVWADAFGAKLPEPRLLDLNKEILLHIIGPATKEASNG